MARRPSLLLGTTVVSVSLVAGVFGIAQPACCQDALLFDLPDRDIAKVEPPEGCKRATERGLALLPQVEGELDDALKTAMRQAVANRDKGETTAEAWHSAASVALLNAHPAAALWAELNAIKSEWSSDGMVQAGIYLALLKKDDDAKLFLHCAYDADNRSPYLLEALANIYRDAGDKPNAVRYIGEALAAAPDDPYIQLEKSYFNTGTMPQLPRPLADPVEASWAELKSHLNNNFAFHKRGEELFAKVQRVYSPDWTDDTDEVVGSLRRSVDEGLASMAEMKRLAQLTPAQFREQYPGSPDSLRTITRNSFFYAVVTYYLRTSLHMLQGPRAPTIDEYYDVGFWSQTLGKETVPYARELRRLREFEFDGTQLRVPGYTHDGWTGAYFRALYQYSQKKRSEGHRSCHQAHYNDPAALDRCLLDVDKKYCATVRLLHRNWMDSTEMHVQTIGRRFDRVAAGMLVGAGEVAADAYRYASEYAKNINAQGDPAAQGYLQEINDLYRQIVADAVGEGTGGPAEVVRQLANTYKLYKQNAETSIAQYGQDIERECQPVDQRALEQLLEEQKDAIRQMLLERLIRDLNISWNPNANCTFSAGKWISVKIDIDGNIETKGKWTPYQKAFEGSPTFEVDDHFKFDIKDGRYVSATVSADKNQNVGPFTGSAGINVGIQHDTRTGETTFPVSIETKLGIGYKTTFRGQEFGVTCYPGDLSAKFDARVIAKDVMDLYNAL